MLVACAGPKMAQDLQAGKESFQGGYYKEAFRKLLPLAAKGKPEAEYAVGYMYYYGYGVSEDSESGIFWMTKACEQNYLPAIRALQLIHFKPSPPEAQSIVPSRQPSSTEARRNAALETMATQPDPESLFVSPPPPPPPPPPQQIKKISYTVTEQNLSEQSVKIEKSPAEPPVKIASSVEEKQQALDITQQARKYALQLYGSYHLSSVKDLQATLRLKNTGHIYQTTHEGKDWYVLTFGNFITAHEASATEHNLPADLKKMHPWVRNINELQLV